MLNQTVLVGRIVREPKVKETENGNVLNMTLAVPRSFKNMNGEYDTDFVDITLWNNLAENTAEYCKKGDLVGIKGRIQGSTKENKDGEKNYNISVVAEKVTFLQSKRKDAPEPER